MLWSKPLSKTITAITTHNNHYHAVTLQRRVHAYELVRCDRQAMNQTTWRAFGLSATGHDPELSETPPNLNLAAGFDSTHTGFYQISVPHMDSTELESAVTMQAETLLPLPMSQMDYAWCTTDSPNGQLHVSIAAARRDLLETFARETRELKPTKIVLDAEAVARAAATLFDIPAPTAVIIYIDQKHAHICRLQNNLLLQAASSEIGLIALAEENEPLNHHAAEQLAQDIFHALKKFSSPTDQSAPELFLLTDDRPLLQAVIAYLNHTELTLKPLCPNPSHFTDHSGDAPPSAISDQTIIDNLIPLGVALAGLEEKPSRLNLFKRISQPEPKKPSRLKIPSILTSAILLVTLTIGYVTLSYATDRVELNQINTYLEQNADVDITQWHQEQDVKNEIIATRPQILELYQAIFECNPSDIELDSIHTIINHPVTITGHTQNRGKLDEFHKNINDLTLSSNVPLPEFTMDAKNKKLINFTITFNYGKTFTAKKRK